MYARLKNPLIAGLIAFAGTLAAAEDPQLNTAANLPGDKGKNVSVVMAPGITRSDQLPPHLANARKALAAKSEVRLSTLRSLADHADGNAAFQYAKTLDFRANPELADDAAHYYGMAAATGRGGAIYGFIRALDALDPSQTSERRLKTLRSILIAYANAGSAPALDAMLRYHTAKKPFSDLDKELKQIAAQAKGPAADAISLQLASEIINSETTDPALLRQAQQHLQSIQDSQSLRLRMISQNLMPHLESQIAKLSQEEIEQ